ncbi:MAG: calcium-binding protein [Elainella sp.]
MSEVIVVNPGGTSTNPDGSTSTGPFLGLNVLNEQPVRIVRDTPTSPVVATGSPGNDTIQAARENSTTVFQISGNAGEDNLSGGAANDRISGGASDDVIRGARGNDDLSGGSEGDTVLGGVGNDTVQGDDGIDVLNGGAGDDVGNGGTGNDTLLGGPGNDELFGEAGNDTIRGGDGDDIIEGGANSDFLIGGAGDDVLTPGSGVDVMKGGAGADTFRFEPGSTGPGSLDRILDFQPGEDVIEISRGLLPQSGLQVGELSDEDFAIVQDIGVASTTATLVYEQKSGIVYYSPADGASVPLLQLQKNLGSLSASDFSLF